MHVKVTVPNLNISGHKVLRSVSGKMKNHYPISTAQLYDCYADLVYVYS